MNLSRTQIKQEHPDHIVQIYQTIRHKKVNTVWQAQITNSRTLRWLTLWIRQLKEIGEYVGETKNQIFIRLVRLALCQVTRDITLKYNFKNIQEFAEARIFGARIVSAAHKIIEKINATFEDTLSRRRKGHVLIETIALKIFSNSITETKICARTGTPKDLMTAIEMSSTWGSKIYGDRLVSKLKLKAALTEKLNTFKKKAKLCQRCNKGSHEYSKSPEKTCIFCDDTLHLSYRCPMVPEELKVNFTCKLCNKKGHTILTCDLKEGFYYQICQLSNHGVDQYA